MRVQFYTVQPIADAWFLKVRDGAAMIVCEAPCSGDIGRAMVVANPMEAVLGLEVAGQVDGYPRGHRYLTMVRRLGRTAAHSTGATR